MYTSEQYLGGGTGVIGSARQYEITIHEIAHASHFNMSHWHFRNSDDMVIESWAVGVAWVFTRLKYPFSSNIDDWQYTTFSEIITKYERKYTPLVIDLIDNKNQRIVHNNIELPLDNVSGGYSIRTIENALNQRRSMNAWRDQLKTTKPAGVTDAQLDELFLNYTPLQ